MSGLLVTMTEPPPEMEEEFNAWYDTEHLPERLAIPARRFKDPSGKPRYLALYELAEASVLEREEWQAALETPWFKRMDRITADCGWILRLYEAYNFGC